MKIIINLAVFSACFGALVVTSSAAVIHFNDYENESSAGLGIQPANMQFTDGGGDHAGQSALGISSANPRSGTYSYAISNTTAQNGNGWGGTWSGVSSAGGNGISTNVTSREDALANGTAENPLSYVDIQAGTTFTLSSYAATDASNPLTGGANTHLRMEFYGANGELNNSGMPRQYSSNLTPDTITTDYQALSLQYTVTEADIAAGLVRVAGVIGSDGHGFGNGDGLVYHDDLLFEVDDASFITVGAVPEPATALFGLLALFGFGFRRRR